MKARWSFARKPPAIDGPKARAQAIRLLVGATDAAFAALTPEGLAASYRLSVKKAAEMLETARARRSQP